MWGMRIVLWKAAQLSGSWSDSDWGAEEEEELHYEDKQEL